MSQIKDGGFAFPCGPDDKAGWSAEYGMTLRDWFAGKALTGLLSTYPTDEVAWEKVSARAYGIADAMITAREVAK